MTFFSTLNYSSCNEDGLTELKALDISPGDKVACITGGGERVLHMLLGNPKKVHAFDANPVQNYLLELKMAAMRHFEYERYGRFLGLFPACDDRLDEYKLLKPDLSAEARLWFDKNAKLILSGILYAGRWERYFRLSAFNIRLLRDRKIRQLFTFNNIDRQKKYLHDEWNNSMWKFFLKLSFSKPAINYLIRDPRYYANVADNFVPSKYINEKITRFLELHLARSSFMLAMVLYGKFFSKDHFPPSLQKKNFEILKKRLHRVTIHESKLFDMLDSDIGQECNKFSLSDVSSFLNGFEYDLLFQRLSEMDDARFCLRDFMTNRGVPKSGKDSIHYHEDLQLQLEIEDLSFGYSFIIGQRG